MSFHRVGCKCCGECPYPSLDLTIANVDGSECTGCSTAISESANNRSVSGLDGFYTLTNPTAVQRDFDGNPIVCEYRATILDTVVTYDYWDQNGCAGVKTEESGGATIIVNVHVDGTITGIEIYGNDPRFFALFDYQTGTATLGDTVSNEQLCGGLLQLASTGGTCKVEVTP